LKFLTFLCKNTHFPSKKHPFPIKKTKKTHTFPIKKHLKTPIPYQKTPILSVKTGKNTHFPSKKHTFICKNTHFLSKNTSKTPKNRGILFKIRLGPVEKTERK
jgi:hypothetical protein